MAWMFFYYIDNLVILDGVLPVGQINVTGSSNHRVSSFLFMS